MSSSEAAQRRRLSSAYRGVLAIAPARALIAASAASQIGNWLYNAALLVYVFDTTRSAAWVAAASICRLLPYIVLAPIGGVLADRHPQRTVLVTGDVLRLVLMVAIAVVIAEHEPVALVIALVAASSAASSAERPATLSLLPHLVGETRMGPANALLHTCQDSGTVIGPAIAALLLTVAPAYVAFLANGATFAVSALLLATLPSPRRVEPEGRPGTVALLSAGLRAARRTRFVIPLFLLVAMVEFTYGAQTVQLVLYAKLALGLGSGGYGLLLAMLGLGGLGSVLASGRLATSRRVTRVVVAATVVACATQLVYAGSHLVAAALVVTVLGGGGLVVSEVVVETVVARVVPRDVLGRIAGLYDMIGVSAMVAGAALASVLVGVLSLRSSFWVLGGAAVAGALASLTGLGGLDAASRRRSDELAGLVDVIVDLPIVAGAPELVLEQLAAASQVCSLPPGIDVVVQGAPAHAFYAVVSGQVLVQRDGEVLAHLGAGEFFGERGLLLAAPRNATVTTEVDSTLLRIEGRAFLDALQAAPSFRDALEARSAAREAPAPPQPTPLVDDGRWVAS